MIIALVFLNYFAIIFGSESRLRKEALNKMEEVMAKEHEMLSLEVKQQRQPIPWNTFVYYKDYITRIIKTVKDQKEVIQDIELLSSQVERCNQILKKLSLNPNEEDDFIDEDISMREYLIEIVSSFKETSNNQFILNFDQDANSKKITKSIEIIYGLRNFIGNANKFCSEKVYIFLKSNNEITEIVIEDDGEGYPADILSKIGEPYLKLLIEE